MEEIQDLSRLREHRMPECLSTRSVRCLKPLTSCRIWRNSELL